MGSPLPSPHRGARGGAQASQLSTRGWQQILFVLIALLCGVFSLLVQPRVGHTQRARLRDQAWDGRRERGDQVWSPRNRHVQSPR